MGVPEATVRMLGRWASDIHRAYTRVALGSAMRVSAAMGHARAVDPERYARQGERGLVLHGVHRGGDDAQRRENDAVQGA